MKDYFDLKNEYFLDFLNDLFGISKTKNWDDIAKNVTLEKIKRTYKVFSEIFPRNYDYLGELEKTKNTFSTIHYGNIKARKIIDEVVRFSLYSDKIIVFHPLQNPSITNQQYDPRKNPKYWLQDFLEALYFYIVIQKWVKAGVVKLIINPCDYDFELRKKIEIEATKRVSNLDESYLTNKFDKKLIFENLAEIFGLEFVNKSKEYIIDTLINMHQPTFTKNQAIEFSEFIINGQNNINPLYNKLNIPLNGNMINTTRGGGSLESIIKISEITNANIYTTSESNWNQVKDFGKDDFWLKTNKLYSDIPLTFLNNVDTNFALELRKEEKLAGVRNQLKKIYSELNGIKIENLSESKVKELQEGFIEEVKNAEAEWMDIRKQAELSKKYWFMANLGIPYIENNLSMIPIALGSIAWLYTTEKATLQKEKLHRQKNSVSVFVDLKNQKQSFFTTLKNSIL
jgi:hypothetical protein